MIALFDLFAFLKFLVGMWLTVLLLIFVIMQYACIEYEDPTRDFEVSYDQEKARRLPARRRCSHAADHDRATCSPDQTQTCRRDLVAYRAPYANQPRRND
jgi:hypothetical protein